MTPIDLLKLIAKELLKEQCFFAVCGGISAGVYRTTFRTTNDLDIAILLSPKSKETSEREFAEKFLARHGIEAKQGWNPDVVTTDDKRTFMIIGQPGGFLPTVDFLLPNLPWLPQAVKRAQENLIDFGFGISVPTITPEDLIIAKAIALKENPKRWQDQADIDSILEGKAIQDWDYLEKELEKYGVSLKELSGN